MNLSQLHTQVQNWVSTVGLRLVVGGVLLFLSFRLVSFLYRRLLRKAEHAAQKRKVDKTIYRTLLYAGMILAKVLCVISLIGYLGIDTGSFSALIASLGVGVGLAVNGTLSNLAGGVLLLITRPFRVDDYIEACGYSGTVESIHICTTKLCTPDNTVIYLPNGTLSTGNIVNYSEKNRRRVDMDFMIPADEDYALAARVLRETCMAHPAVLSEPPTVVRVSQYTAEGVCLSARPWCENAVYWDVRYDLLERCKDALNAVGMVLPRRQLDVYLHVPRVRNTPSSL